MQKQLIRFPALSQKLGGISKSTIDRWEKSKTFPARMHIGKNSVAWNLQDVEHWIEKQTGSHKEGDNSNV